jgi:hypothetical protein
MPLEAFRNTFFPERGSVSKYGLASTDEAKK